MQKHYSRWQIRISGNFNIVQSVYTKFPRVPTKFTKQIFPKQWKGKKKIATWEDKHSTPPTPHPSPWLLSWEIRTTKFSTAQEKKKLENNFHLKNVEKISGDFRWWDSTGRGGRELKTKYSKPLVERCLGGGGRGRWEGRGGGEVKNQSAFH